MPVRTKAPGRPKALDGMSLKPVKKEGKLHNSHSYQKSSERQLRNYLTIY